MNIHKVTEIVDEAIAAWNGDYTNVTERLADRVVSELVKAGVISVDGSGSVMGFTTAIPHRTIDDIWTRDFLDSLDDERY